MILCLIILVNLIIISYFTFNVDLNGLIISNRPDEVRELDRAKSQPFLSQIFVHEPLGYNPIMHKPTALRNKISTNNYY